MPVHVPVRRLLIGAVAFVTATLALGALLDVVTERLRVPHPERTVAVVQPPARIGGPVLVAVGDSLSVGYLSNDGSISYLDAARSYPGVAARMIGARLLDLAIPGARCTQSSRREGTPIPSALSVVSRIPMGVRVVVVNCGTNDVLRGSSAARDFRAVVTAVHARCPAAHLVIVTLRTLRRSSAGSIEAWNVEERAVARAYGADIVDLENEAPGVNPDWPDGIHPTRGAAEALGSRIARVLRSHALSMTPVVP